MTAATTQNTLRRSVDSIKQAGGDPSLMDQEVRASVDTYINTKLRERKYRNEAAATQAGMVEAKRDEFCASLRQAYEPNFVHQVHVMFTDRARLLVHPTVGGNFTLPASSSFCKVRPAAPEPACGTPIPAVDAVTAEEAASLSAPAKASTEAPNCSTGPAAAPLAHAIMAPPPHSAPPQPAAPTLTLVTPPPPVVVQQPVVYQRTGMMQRPYNSGLGMGMGMGVGMGMGFGSMAQTDLMMQGAVDRIEADELMVDASMAAACGDPFAAQVDMQEANMLEQQANFDTFAGSFW